MNNRCQKIKENIENYKNYIESFKVEAPEILKLGPGKLLHEQGMPMWREVFENIKNIKKDIELLNQTEKDQYQSETGEGNLDNIKIFDIDGQLVFTGLTEKGDIIAKGDGKRVARNLEDIGNIGLFHDQLYYVSLKNGKRLIRLESGATFGSKYNSVHSPFVVNGIINYFAEMDGIWFLVRNNEEEFFRDGEYESIKGPYYLDSGKMLFRVRKNGMSFVITEDGKVVSDKYELIRDIVVSKYRADFIVKIGGDYYIDTYNGGKKIKGPFREVLGSKIINEKLFLLSKPIGSKKWALFNEDGNQISKSYDQINDYVYINDHFYLDVENAGNNSVVNESGKVLGRGKYNRSTDPVEINGQVAYKCVSSIQKWGLAIDGVGMVLDGKYDTIDVVKEIKDFGFYIMGQRDGLIVKDVYEVNGFEAKRITEPLV